MMAHNMKIRKIPTHYELVIGMIMMAPRIVELGNRRVDQGSFSS